MKMFKRAAVTALVVVAWTLAGLVGMSMPAGASVAVKTSCSGNGWYVNDDETALAPTQVVGGLVFNGPSLAHHAMTPLALASTPTDGTFFTVGPVTGVRPLFKLETTAPYSTINKTSTGKYWSSKITSGPGSQSSPVDTIADLMDKATGNGGYTADTRVFSFGVGYANDTGNRAVVTGVRFGGHTYPMRCAGSPDASPAASRSASPTPGAASLPVTGSNLPLVVAGGAGLLALGAGLLVLARRRRAEFHA